MSSEQNICALENSIVSLKKISNESKHNNKNHFQYIKIIDSFYPNYVLKCFSVSFLVYVLVTVTRQFMKTGLSLNTLVGRSFRAYSTIGLLFQCAGADIVRAG